MVRANGPVIKAQKLFLYLKNYVILEEDMNNRNRHILILALSILIGFMSNAQQFLKSIDHKAFKAYTENHIQLAESYANQVVQSAIQYDTSKYLINAYTLLGIINKDKGYYLSALEYYLKGLECADKRKDDRRASALYNNIGMIYQLQKNYEVAIEYFDKSLDIENHYSFDLDKSIRYYNIGDCYKSMDSFDIALSYFNNSLIIEKKHNNTEGIVYAYLGISEIYLRLKQFDDAKMILNKIEPLLKKESVEEAILFYKLKGMYLYEVKQYEEALSSLSKAVSISQTNKFPIHLMDIYTAETHVLEKLGKYDVLTSKYKALFELSDTLATSEIRNKSYDLTFSYELKKKQLELDMMLKEKEFVSNLNLFNNKVTWLLIVLLVSVLGYIFYIVKIKGK
jgi:tetratricopeptide (TPR) repeat protein